MDGLRLLGLLPSSIVIWSGLVVCFGTGYAVRSFVSWIRHLGPIVRRRNSQYRKVLKARVRQLAGGGQC